MAVVLSGFCPSCNKTLYVDESTTPFCPVCSSPVLPSIERDGGEDAAGAPSDEAVADGMS